MTGIMSTNKNMIARNQIPRNSMSEVIIFSVFRIDSIILCRKHLTFPFYKDRVINLRLPWGNGAIRFTRRLGMMTD